MDFPCDDAFLNAACVALHTFQNALSRLGPEWAVPGEGPTPSTPWVLGGSGWLTHGKEEAPRPDIPRPQLKNPADTVNRKRPCQEVKGRNLALCWFLCLSFLVCRSCAPLLALPMIFFHEDGSGPLPVAWSGPLSRLSPPGCSWTCWSRRYASRDTP